MKKNLLLQGFSDNTYAEEVRWVLSTPDIQHAIISVAFLNEEGVLLLEEDLQRIVTQAVFYCGVRNEITSYQGLLRLVNNGHTVYTVDTGSRGRIFHPKIYYARGSEIARISVGSGNLTLGGLNNNIEAGLGLEVDLGNDDDKSFVEDFESRFTTLHQQYPDNVTLAENAETLERMLSSGILLDELEASPPRPSSANSKTKSSTDDPVPRIKLPVSLLYPTVRKNRRVKKLAEGKPIVVNPVAANLLRVWESKPLGERNLNIPSGTNTHPTGALGLDKGRLAADIDHRHYFRDEVFDDLDWLAVPGKETEKATAVFQLVIKNRYVGDFELTITHSTSTTSRSYEQKNTMTYLSWGDARSIIAKPDYIGRTLTLYSDETDTKRFVIDID